MKRAHLAIWLPALVITGAGAAYAQASATEEAAPPVSSPPPASASAPPEESGPAASAPEEYVVRAGDTLSSIAERLTGNRENWVGLARANGIADPSKLRVGLRLKIPAELRST